MVVFLLKGNKMDLQQMEWDAWREIVRILKSQNAVTKEDLNSFITEEGTPGRLLFRALRNWGDLRFLQGKNQSKEHL